MVRRTFNKHTVATGGRDAFSKQKKEYDNNAKACDPSVVCNIMGVIQTNPSAYHSSTIWKPTATVAFNVITKHTR